MGCHYRRSHCIWCDRIGHLCFYWQPIHYLSGFWIHRKRHLQEGRILLHDPNFDLPRRSVRISLSQVHILPHFRGYETQGREHSRRLGCVGWNFGCHLGRSLHHRKSPILRQLSQTTNHFKAEVIPFFSDLLSLMSSLFDSFFGFIFWGVAFIRMRRVDGGVTWLRDQTIWGYMELALNVFIIIVGLFFLSAGTYTSVQAIINSYAAGQVGGVFKCANTGI